MATKILPRNAIAALAAIALTGCALSPKDTAGERTIKIIGNALLLGGAVYALSRGVKSDEDKYGEPDTIYKTRYSSSGSTTKVWRNR